MDFQLVEHKESAWIIQIISFEIISCYEHSHTMTEHIDRAVGAPLFKFYQNIIFPHNNYPIQYLRSLPQKNNATVPGPVCAPIIVPI